MDCIIPCFSVLLFESGGQSIWASASVLPMKIQGLFPLGFTGLISLLSKGLSTFFSSTTVWKHQFFITQPSLSSNSHIRTWLLENDFDYTNIFDYAKLMSLLFNMLSRFVIAFVPKGKHLLISWLQSPTAVILEPKKMKSITISMVSASICHEVMRPDAMILIFWMLSFKPTFHSPLSLSSSGSSVLHFLPLGWCHLHI